MREESHPVRLSVVIPALNEVDPILSLLQDLSPLRSAGHEVIVVDGGSSDATFAMALPLADRVIAAPRGRASQMNAGACVASGDLLWFLHADSRVSPNAAQAVLAIWGTERPWGRFDVRLSGSRPLLRIVAHLMNLRSCLTGIATGDQGIFVTRTAFKAVGGYPSIPLMEDIALSRLLRKRTFPVCVHRPRLITSSRRWETQGVLSTILLMWRLRLAYALGVAPEKLARHYSL